MTGKVTDYSPLGRNLRFPRDLAEPTNLQLQEESPTLLPLLNTIEKLPVCIITLLQLLDLSVVQSQQLFCEILCKKNLKMWALCMCVQNRANAIIQLWFRSRVRFRLRPVLLLRRKENRSFRRELKLERMLNLTRHCSWRKCIIVVVVRKWSCYSKGPEKAVFQKMLVVNTINLQIPFPLPIQYWYFSLEY